ncbi:MAG: anti-sigma-I factor RsgI family protein [Bacillota bacterium]
MSRRLKNILKGAIAIAIVAVLSLTFLSGCERMEQNTSASAYVSVSINPEFDLIVDEDEKVEAVYCLNEDAEVLLVDLDLVGMDFYEAMEIITNLATEEGFIDVDSEDNEVIIDIVTDDENSEIKEEMHSRVRERLHKYFENSGIFGRVSQGTLEEYAEEALELNMPLGHTKMILRALEIDPLLEIEDLKEMPINEIARNMTKSVRKIGVDAVQRQEFISQRDAIVEEHSSELDLLKQEIALLKSQLAELEGDEERSLIEDQLIEKREELELLKEEMRKDMEDLASQYKENLPEIAQDNRAKASQRMQNNRGKARQRKESINEKRAKAVRDYIKERD